MPHRIRNASVRIGQRHGVAHPSVDRAVVFVFVRLSSCDIGQSGPALALVQQHAQGLAMTVLHGRRPNVAHPQAQPGQLVVHCRHLAVANDDDLLQR